MVKKNIPRKIDSPTNIWGTTAFDLLVIHFSVDLELLPLKLWSRSKQSLTSLNQWKKRNLSPVEYCDKGLCYALITFSAPFPHPTKSSFPPITT